MLQPNLTQRILQADYHEVKDSGANFNHSAVLFPNCQKRLKINSY